MASTCIRLLDAPLHEFLPPYEAVQAELLESQRSGAPPEEIKDKETFLLLVDSLREENPMLGHRGCRLGLSFPAIGLFAPTRRTTRCRRSLWGLRESAFAAPNICF